MCGILVCSNKVSSAKFNDALKSLRHRGPDGFDSAICGKYKLGHTRLAIVGGKTGKQPIWNEAKTIAAVVNGEFYEMSKLRGQLIKLGHKFSTQSDSELVVHLYEEYGFEALNKLRGEFAFALVDSVTNQLWVVRDRFGIRPIFFGRKKGEIVIASKAETVLSILNLRSQIDPSSLNFASQYQYLPQQHSWFKGVKILPPGFELIISHGSLKFNRYWKLPKEQGHTTNNIRELKRHITEAVKIRIPKEVKACTHLSGGVDSSIITLIAQRYGVNNAFTVSFPGKNEYDELNYTRKTAKQIGVDLNVVEVTLKDILENFKEAITTAEGTCINGHGVAKYLLSKCISKNGFKVALTGEGADEIFYGYGHFLIEAGIKPAMDEKVKGIHTPLKLPTRHIVWTQAKVELMRPLRNMLCEFKKKNLTSELGIEAAAQTWITYCLGGYILQTLDDGMGMAHAVESRLPFLDHKLVEWVKQNVPTKEHMRGPLGKTRLREGFKDELPEVTNRIKRPFMAPPIQLALAGELRGLILEPLNNADIPNINKRRMTLWVKNIQKEANAGNIKPENEAVLSMLLSLAYLFPKT